MDIKILFSTRVIRLCCYGFLSVVLALYLIEAGLTEGQIGLLFTLTLAGRRGHFTISNHLRRSNRATTHTHHWRATDGRVRRGFHLHE